MLLLILGIVDVLVGVSLVFPNFLGLYLGIITIIKGLSSMLGLPTGDIIIVLFGLMDMAAGIMLLTGFSVPWFWLIIVIKGMFSVISGMG